MLNVIQKDKMISALSTGNIGKYEFLTIKDVLSQKYLLEKAATIKEFVYSALDTVLKVQTSIAEKQYQVLAKAYEFHNVNEFKKRLDKDKKITRQR